MSRKETPVIEVKGGDTIILENDCLLTRKDIREGECILKAENNYWKCRVNKIIPMGGELKLVCADFLYYSDDGETWTTVYKNEM